VYFIQSEIEGRRAILSHTWLDNQLLLYLSTIRRALEPLSDHALPVVIVDIPHRLEKLRELIDDATSGLSPAQLVDIGPLASMGTETRILIKNAVHGAYLDLNIVQPLVEELKTAADELDCLAQTIIQGWQQNVENRCQLLENLEEVAVKLRDLLKSLPREVVFP
jgi:hypothetical protein